MKIPKECKVEKCVSTDKMRGMLQLQHIYLHRTDETDRSRGRMVATDGRRMAIVPVEFEDGDTDGFLTLDMFKAARKATGTKADRIQLGLNGTVKLSNGTVLPKVPLDATYPNYKAVIPTEEPKFTVALNARMLWELAEAIGSDGVVKLQFIDELSPIRVTYGKSEALGVLMPCRFS